ncbi:STAS domain-containing protein [Cryptosporangium arvum]|uniref:Anti-anti-sigma regulatory factor (Antagonist of anti-sigma factor) n=1 Tax=Cryptosporangium arvum DSM 44712 TaxID=927661 RepID=A0A011AJJ5_9ACTN|nr:STAS domain-containing protein [Cryptosporangium arvum]EXG82181.1 anti-anti-sigma regulatory factor (antagonist of anti-sigma factor) [Cryptosporangium arvum DSM 44712]
MRTGSGHRLSLLGELDQEGALVLRRRVEHLETSTGGRAVLDCGCLWFIDARGLNALLYARAFLGDSGVSLELVEPTPMLRRVLAATELTDALPVVS